MALDLTLRGCTRATTTMLAIAALAVSPAVADAAKTKKVAKKPTAALKEAGNKKPATPVVATGLTAATQLAAMHTAIEAAPTFFNRPNRCVAVTPMLATQAGAILAGNFRDDEGNCYVWLNLQQSASLTGPEICKTTLHEMGHLAGLAHSQDKNDVMFSPFRSDPIPSVCQPPAASSAKKICPPGATNEDYCQAVGPSKPKKAAASRLG